MSAYQRAMDAERARLAAAAKRSEEFAREQIERETGMSADLDRAFELVFEAGRDRASTEVQGRLGLGAGDKKRRRTDVDDPALCGVYVRGLPLDVTFSRVEQHFARCGDVQRVKLYKDSAGKPKGDALVTFKKELAARRALEELNGTDLFGYVLKLSAADFSAAGAASGEQSAAERIAEAAGQRARGGGAHDMNQLRVVVLCNAFSLDEVARSGDAAHFFAELEDDMWIGCAGSGHVERAKAFPSDPECCCSVRFVVARDAAACVALMEGRVYNGRTIHAMHWDGNLRRAPPDGVDEDRARRLGGAAPPPAAAAPLPATSAPPATASAAGAAPTPSASGPDAAPATVGAIAALPPAADLAALSVKELRALLRERAIDASGCVEKQDLVRLLLDAQRP